MQVFTCANFDGNDLRQGRMKKASTIPKLGTAEAFTGIINGNYLLFKELYITNLIIISKGGAVKAIWQTTDIQ